MVETGTSSYYTALADATDEPVLEQICRLIAADEYRHFKLFYDHMQRYLAREQIGVLRRLRIAAGRITETEDDELAYAYHCGNDAGGVPYEHERCIAGYMGRAMGFYRYNHIERSIGMILKAVGLPPRGRLSRVAGPDLLEDPPPPPKTLRRRLPTRLTPPPTRGEGSAANHPLTPGNTPPKLPPTRRESGR